MITATVLALIVAAYEDVDGGVGLVVWLAQVHQLGFFNVVKQGAFHFGQQAVVEMKTHFDEGGFEYLQADVTQVVLNVHAILGSSHDVLDTLYLEQQLHRLRCIVGLRVQVAKADLASFE